MTKEILKIHEDYKKGIIGLVLLLILLSPNLSSGCINLFKKNMNLFLETLCKNDNLASLLQGVGMALLTILIPLAIAVLTGFLEKKSKREEYENGGSFFVFELHMVLDYILDIKQLLWSSALIFLPVLFWEKSSLTLRKIELAAWLIGIIFLTYRILKVYEWIKSFDFSFHRSYLERLEKKEDMENIWNLVWQKKIKNIRDEAKFLEIFSKKINKLLEK